VEIVLYNTRNVMVNAVEDQRCTSVVDGGWKHLGEAAADISGSDACVAARLALTWAVSLVEVLWNVSEASAEMAASSQPVWRTLKECVAHRCPHLSVGLSIWRMVEVLMHTDAIGRDICDRCIDMRSTEAWLYQLHPFWLLAFYFWLGNDMSNRFLLSASVVLL